MPDWIITICGGLIVSSPIALFLQKLLHKSGILGISVIETEVNSYRANRQLDFKERSIEIELDKLGVSNQSHLIAVLDNALAFQTKQQEMQAESNRLGRANELAMLKFMEKLDNTLTEIKAMKEEYHQISDMRVDTINAVTKDSESHLRAFIATAFKPMEEFIRLRLEERLQERKMLDQAVAQGKQQIELLTEIRDILSSNTKPIIVLDEK